LRGWLYQADERKEPVRRGKRVLEIRNYSIVRMTRQCRIYQIRDST
jgi:hypothetical protein